jgi:two-component system response regulator YesN
MSERIHVVIADDEPMIRRGLSRLIQQNGPAWHILGTFSNGLEALQYFKTTEERIDLLVTDVKMPEMDGLRLIKEAKTHQSFIPLVISGYDDFEYVRTALKEGVIDYVLKPIDREMLSAQLTEIVKKIRHKRYADEIEYLKSCTLGYGQETVGSAWKDQFADGPYRLCCVSMDEPPHRMRNYTDRNWKLLYYAVNNIVEDCVHSSAGKGSGKGWIWQEGSGRVWVLLNNVEEAEELAEHIRSSINRFLGLTVTISAGPEFVELPSLPEYRDEALTLLYLRLIYGGNRVFSKDGMLSSPVSEIAAKLHPFGERLRIAIMQDDENETIRMLNECFDEMEALHEPGALEKVVQYMILQIMSMLLVSDHKKAKELMQTEWDQVHDLTSSFHRLRKRLEGLALQAATWIRGSRDRTERAPVDKAKQYIRNHLTDPLTIQSIAEKIPMSPTYFCKLFKLQTGETIHDYIRGRRMEAAAKRLLETEEKLQDIAEKVGYKDVKYFSGQFRKHFGILPSKYKEMSETP